MTSLPSFESPNQVAFQVGTDGESLLILEDVDDGSTEPLVLIMGWNADGDRRP